MEAPGPPCPQEVGKVAPPPAAEGRARVCQLLVLAEGWKTEVRSWAMAGGDAEVSVTLGVDPGLLKGSAWAIVDPDEDTCEVGVFKPREDWGSDSMLLADYADQLRDLIDAHPVDLVGIETQHARVRDVRMVQGVVKVAAMRGALTGAAAACGVRVVAINPRTAKAAILGHGNADKRQIVAMVRTMFPHLKRLSQDKADAVAIALAAERRAG